MPHRRIEVLLFVLAWISFAYFHQGGGWNQNARFALTRALVESRQPWIDDYLVYASNGPKGSPALRRLPVSHGAFTDGGRAFALAWRGPDKSLIPMAPDAPTDARLVPADWAGASADLAFAGGHVHPNKAPGASVAAAPGYAVLFALERSLGIDPDAAWTLTANAWLAGALSVGLVAALGVVVFWRLAMRLSGGRAETSLFATVAFAFGTLYFPYATMLMDHDLVAVALMGSFLFALDGRSNGRFFAAGLCAAASILASYLSVVAAALVGAYVLWRAKRPSGVLAYCAGAIPPLAILAAYNLACFGKLVTTNYAQENPLFRQAGGGLFELFGAPRGEVALALLVSPMRGLLVGSPVLMIGVIGLVVMLRARPSRPEGLLCAAMIGHVFLFNVSFTAWNGGWACGPRYLIPALPFLALPIVFAPPRAVWVRRALLTVSVAAMTLATAVDPQTPFTASGTWAVSPVWGIDLPQFLDGTPGSYAVATWPDTIVARYAGPVSVNPIGVYEATPGRVFSADSPQATWSSFNAGEWAFPGRKLSLAPWLALASALALWVRREGRRLAGSQRAA